MLLDFIDMSPLNAICTQIFFAACLRIYLLHLIDLTYLSHTNVLNFKMSGIGDSWLLHHSKRNCSLWNFSNLAKQNKQLERCLDHISSSPRTRSSSTYLQKRQTIVFYVSFWKRKQTGLNDCAVPSRTEGSFWLLKIMKIKTWKSF